MSENSYNEENTIDVDFEITSEVDVQVGTVYQSGASTLAGLSDVNLTTPSDSQALTYDSASSKWINTTIETGATIDDTTTSSTKTWSSQKINTELGAKADSTNVYTKTQADSLLDEKADLDQILLTGGNTTYKGPTYPQPDSYIPFSMWFEMRNVDNANVYAWTEPNTSSQGYSFETGTIIDVIDQVSGEDIDGVTTWHKFEDPSRGTLYVNGYYTIPLYRIDFNYPVAGEKVNKFEVFVKPDQFGSGYPQPGNFRPIKEWDEIRIKVDNTIYEISLPTFMVGGWVELADGDGSGSSDYDFVDMGDLSWTATADSAIFYAEKDIQNNPLDFEAPSDTSTTADIYCTSYRLASQDDVEGKVTDNTICGMSPNNGIEIYSTAFIGKNATWVRSALGGRKLAFKSTNPISFTFSGYTHLTDVIESKAGNNRIYVDCGNISECVLPKNKVPADGLELSELTNVNLTSPTNNQSLIYDSEYNRWVNGTISGGASALEDLSDVAFSSSINTNQALIYNSGTSKWENKQLYYDVTGTLTAGSTQLILSYTHGSDIPLSTATVDTYTDVYGVNPTNITISGNDITLTFEAQSSNVGVKVRVWR